MDMAQPMPPEAMQAPPMPAPAPMTPQMPQALQQAPAPTHDVVIKTTRKSSQARVMPVPPEEFGISRDARNVRDASYCFHKLITLTQADLIGQGYDADQIKGLPTYSLLTNTEELARDTVNEYQLSGDQVNDAARIVEVTEHYIRMDYEGNGKACLYKVTAGGSQGDVLTKDGKPDIEKIDVMPFAAMTPVIITHRFFGRSLADLIMDIQRIKTALIRGALDNLYLHNNPRVEVSEQNAGPNTLDDLLVSRPGGVVRTKTPGGLNWQVTPDITGSVYPALEYFDATLESRTGVTKRGQGLDADALANQSATAAQLGHSASQERMKLIARIFAETGIKDLFVLLHGMIRRHGQQAQTVRLRNKWVDVDPRDWKNRNDLTVHVGIGSGDKAEQAQQLMALMNIQKTALEGGMTNLVTPKNIYNAATAFSKVVGHKNADKYFTNPDTVAPPQPPQDPKVMQLQLQAQLDQKADERKAQIEQVQMQADIEAQDRKTQAEMVQNDRDFDLKAKLAMMQAQLEMEKFRAEEARKEREHAQKMELARETHQHTIAQAQLGMAATAMGHDAKMEQMKNAPKAGE